MTKKKPLDPDLRAECDAANAIFLERMNLLGLTKSGLAAEIGVSGPAIGYFLDGTNQLNAKFASHFSRVVGVPVESFSKRLADEIRDYRKALLADDGSKGVAERAISIAALASDRSRLVLERIAAAATDGRLTEADLILLEQIAARFERSDKSETKIVASGGNTSLRERLRKNDSNTQQ